MFKVCATGQCQLGNILREVFTVDLRISSCLKSWRNVLRLSVHGWFLLSRPPCFASTVQPSGRGIVQGLGECIALCIQHGDAASRVGRRRRTFGIITQGICWFSDSCFGGWIIVASICYTECSAIALYFLLPFPTSAADSCGEQGATNTSALRKGSGRVCAEITLDIEPSRWSCWQLAEQWRHLLWPIILLLLFHLPLMP